MKYKEAFLCGALALGGVACGRSLDRDEITPDVVTHEISPDNSDLMKNQCIRLFGENVGLANEMLKIHNSYPDLANICFAQNNSCFAALENVRKSIEGDSPISCPDEIGGEMCVDDYLMKTEDFRTFRSIQLIQRECVSASIKCVKELIKLNILPPSSPSQDGNGKKPVYL